MKRVNNKIDAVARRCCRGQSVSQLSFLSSTGPESFRPQTPICLHVFAVWQKPIFEARERSLVELPGVFYLFSARCFSRREKRLALLLSSLKQKYCSSQFFYFFFFLFCSFSYFLSFSSQGMLNCVNL